jgi:phage terminase large subunit-like protein
MSRKIPKKPHPKRGSESYPDDPGTLYALEVVAGRVVVGQLVRRACQRHLDDLRAAGKRGLYYDVEEAVATLNFWKLCPHVKGRKWAGETIHPEPWQAFVLCSVYGWKKTDGTRRFRVVWVELARKNGKSTLAYPATLHGLLVDGEPGGEVYSVATKKDQARIVYGLARQAAIRVPEFAERLVPYRNTLLNEETDSKFEAISSDADTLDGLNPSVVICDEVHKWRGRDLWDVIDTATGARDQPLIWVVTTAGPEGNEDVYGQEHDYTRQVLEGVVEDDSRFGYIACLDPEDDWREEKNWIKANPNLGVSVRKDEIRQAAKKAVASPHAESATKRLRFGIRSQDAEAWIPLRLWDAGKVVEFEWSRLENTPCCAALDLASSSDFAALALCWPIEADLSPAVEWDRPWGYLFRWRLWLPEGWQTQREEQIRKLAAPWVPKWVTHTAGDVIDHDVIEKTVLDLAKKYRIQTLAFDPWNATQLSVHLANGGVNVAKFDQKIGQFAGPSKKFGEVVAGGRLKHDGNPCARWMADNVVTVGNAAEQFMPSRKRSRNKIDGIVAAVMALGAVLATEPPRRSWYEDHDLESV